MKYCLSIGLHNLFFDIAIVDSNHNLIKSYKCDYDRSKDISNNIFIAYKKYFIDYKIECLGVGVSNNIIFKDDILYSLKAFDLNQYNLKQSLHKLFKVDIYIGKETYLASLATYNTLDKSSLLYIVLDNKISNSFVVEGEIIELEEDIDFLKNRKLNSKCNKDALKAKFLVNNYDDEYIGGYFLSKDKNISLIIDQWAKELNKNVEKIVKEIKVDGIVFAGYLGEYFPYFKDSMNISKKIDCFFISSHNRQSLIGISHLMFKDKRSRLENKI